MAPPSRKLLSSPIVTLLCLFYLFSSTALAASAVLGVDLGTEYIKAALVKPGIPLEIVLTKDSRRKETAAVAFKPGKSIKSGVFPERVYGSDAVALSARFPDNVYPNLKRVLGLSADNPVVEDYAIRHPALKLEADKTRGTAAFKSSAFTAEEEAWTVEEILAMELQSIQKNAEALAGKGSRIRDLIITVPPFYTVEEKRAVELAADLAGLRIVELISDGLAVGLNYATSRTFPSINEGGKPETHMVFDMGAGSTKATILKFQGRTVKDVGKYNKTIQEVRVLGSGWDRTLGGDALNSVIVDDMIYQFVTSPAAKTLAPTTKAVQAHGRAAAKLWKEAERLRHILSANANTQTSFEGLYEDLDFKYKITRAEFEKLTESYVERVATVMKQALAIAKLEVKDLDSIILHGGAVRTPFVQKQLEKWIGNADKVRTNVNADEAAVFGAGFRGAGLSPSFRVKDIKAFEAAGYPAGIKYTDVNDKSQTQQIWLPTSFLGAVKTQTFKNQADPFLVQFYQKIPASEGLSLGPEEQAVVTLTSQNLTESVTRLKEKFSCSDADINLKLSARLAADNGEVEVTSLVVDCEIDLAVEKESMVDSVKGMFGFGKKDQIPLAEDNEASSDSTSSMTTSEATSSSSSSSASASSSSKAAKESKENKVPKPTKRWEIIPIKYTLVKNGRPQLPASELKRMKDRIASFDDSDRSRRLREETLNQLEGFTYKVRDLLDSEEFIAASTKAERESLEAKSKAASEWIYAGGAEASREELKAKLKEMKDIVEPIEFRREEATKRPEQLEALQSALNQTLSVISGITEQIANDTKNHEAFSSSVSADAASSSASPSATPTSIADDFDGLEDEEATETSTALPEEKTMDPPVYKSEDLVKPQEAYDGTSAWLKKKLAEQDKLSPTDDPVLLSSEMAVKAKVLQEIHIDLIMKSMRQPYKSSRPTKKIPPKPKAKKTGTKSKKNASKTKSAAKGEKTIDLKGPDGRPKFRVGEDGELPSEEDILAFIEKQKQADAAKEKGSEEEMVDKHDEL